MHRRVFFVAFGLACLVTQSVLATPLGIISGNFVGGQNGPNGSASVTTTAGFEPAANWNNLSGAIGGPLSLLNNSGVGAATGSWTSSNTWAATGVAPGGGSNASMMSGYLDNFASGTVTVSGLGSEYTSQGYSVYAYFNADSAGRQGFRVTDSLANVDTAFGNQQNGAGTNYPLGGLNGFIVSEDTNSGTSTIANVVKLTGFFGPSFTLVGINGTAGPDNRARLNGFQIVSNALLPEPASIALWSLLGAGAVAFCVSMKRRRK